MITTVFFDLDDTLLDFNRAEETALSATLREAGLEPAPELTARYSEINLSLWKALERGELSVEELRVRRFAMLFAELGLSLPAAETAERYEEHLSHGAWFVAGAEEVLRELHGRHRLFLASNGIPKVQRGRLRDAGILPYFEDVFISGELGAGKPSPEFFCRAFARIRDFRADEAVMVGDSLSSDMAGGLAAGLTTVWFDRRGEDPGVVQPHYRITHLDELPELLNLINSVNNIM